MASHQIGRSFAFPRHSIAAQGQEPIPDPNPLIFPDNPLQNPLYPPMSSHISDT
jgi:hypothetical protein